MIQEKIDRLIPFMSDNFITFPLWEEGRYIPFVNFWQVINLNSRNINDIIEEFSKKNKLTYNLEFEESSNNVSYFTIYPDYIVIEDGSHVYTKVDWSIEEMLDIVYEFITYIDKEVVTNK